MNRAPAALLLVSVATFEWSVRAERDVVIAQHRTPVDVTRLFTGSDGKSHVEHIEVKLASVGGAAVNESSEAISVSGLQFCRLSPTFSRDFNPAPARQYVVTVRSGEVELEDGTRIPVAPGHVLLAEDTTGKGHISRVLGSEDHVVLLIQLADK